MSVTSQVIEVENRVAGKTAEEIVALFKRLGFTDQLGHQLTDCEDFLRLAGIASNRHKAITRFFVGSEHLDYFDPTIPEEEVLAARARFVKYGDFHNLDEAIACAEQSNGKITAFGIVNGRVLFLHLSDKDIGHYLQSSPPPSITLHAGQASQS